MPLTALQQQHGPFAEPKPAHYPGTSDHMTTCDAESRLSLVKQSTDPDWLRAVIRDRDVQSTVRLAAERRLRKVIAGKA